MGQQQLFTLQILQADASFVAQRVGRGHGHDEGLFKQYFNLHARFFDRQRQQTRVLSPLIKLVQSD